MASPAAAAASDVPFDHTLVDNEFETHVRAPSRAHTREAKHVLAGAPAAQAAAAASTLLVIVTMQRARVDLVQIGDAVEAEKDRLLEAFYAVSKSVCGALAEAGYVKEDAAAALLLVLLLLPSCATAAPGCALADSATPPTN